MSSRRLLVFNCHEAWVHQLEGIGLPLEIVVGLPGRYHPGWDERMRPVPKGARLLPFEALARAQAADYEAIISHGVTDLLDVKRLEAPKLVVLHSTIEGRIIETGSFVEPREMGDALRQLLDMIGGHALSVSALKGRSWGVTEDVVPFAVDVDAYEPGTLELDEGLRISNFFDKRRTILLGDLHERAFHGLPLLLVGQNPGVANARSVDSWAELKQVMSSHRFYVHTAHPALEDGYNMATLEAMASALPILGNLHPSSPIEHGVSGFLSNDPAELRAYAEQLLSDRALAVRMGGKARETAAARFRMADFHESFRRSIETARCKFIGKRDFGRAGVAVGHA